MLEFTINGRLCMDNKDSTKKFIGHKNQETGEVQPLPAHLENVGRFAEAFAAAFGAGKAGRIAGTYHDIGKYAEPVRRRMETGQGRPYDHSTAGAKELYQAGLFPEAVCVAGHHSGLLDGGSRVSSKYDGTFLGRIKKEVPDDIPDYQAYRQDFPKPQAAASMDVCEEIQRSAFNAMFYIRMLFSCLVDADFLDTAAFMQRRRAAETETFDRLDTLKERLDAYIQKFLKSQHTEIQRKRTDALRQCIAMGEAAADTLYTLTVPTGGGKTISSMAFALHYACRMKKRRIIYVIPYTSIIEQNAAVFKDILGEKNVIEHHMNVMYDDADESSTMKRLAAENWDGPVIVTTNVQFFESLFHNKPSKCRKLHNIADSVIVFDEAQMIPVGFLKPCMQCIDELTTRYTCAAVLCTATQPPWQQFFGGRHIQEIYGQSREMNPLGQRVAIRVMPKAMSVKELAAALETHHQALCIVNLKKTARRVFRKMQGEGIYHLSTNMYPAHRMAVLKEIRERLRRRERCIVISTSLLESGVDISFPYVYREMAGLDSIIQAAGRCSREGEWTAEERGVFVFSFKAEEVRPASYMRQEREAAERICSAFAGDIRSPEAVRAYFELLYSIKGDGLDKNRIMKLIQERVLPFAQVAAAFKIIESAGMAVLIAHRDEHAMHIAERLRNGERSKELLREGGRYSVHAACGSPDAAYELLCARSQIEILDEGISILTDAEAYDEQMGLLAEDIYR